jgi:hypothetical protein
MNVKKFGFPIFLSVLFCCHAVHSTEAYDVSEPSPRRTDVCAPLIKDFIGVNGHFHFKPELYSRLTRLVRNYHDMIWDVDAPGGKITIPECSNGVNWKEHVYGPWKEAGYETDICLQMSGFFPRETDKYKQLWEGKEDWMFTYGKTLASFYGPSGKEQLCTSVEIGNEPGGDIDQSLYKVIFKNIASGIREGDPKIKILTPAVQTRDADEWIQNINDVYADREIIPLYDVINMHTYAVLNKNNQTESPWNRTYPEAATTDFLKIVDEMVEWRNRNTPDKEIRITEFGWDACTPDAMKERTDWFLKLNWQGTTDLQQAQYLVRSVFLFAERDIQRAYVYWFDDNDTPGVHASSGLTRHFEPKMSFRAMEQLYRILGDYAFSKVVQRTDSATGKPLYVYEFVHGEHASRKIWVAWSPTGCQTNTKEGYQPISFVVSLTQLPGKITGVKSMTTGQTDSEACSWEQPSSASVTLTVSESPVYILME